jgi:hypothetical protein
MIHVRARCAATHAQNGTFIARMPNACGTH